VCSWCVEEELSSACCVGSVPSMYREFYDVVCATSNDQFDRDLFVRVLAASGLSQDVLAQVLCSFLVVTMFHS